MTSYFYPHFREREVARARAGWLVAHPDLALQGRYSPARARAGQHSKSLPAYIMQSVGPNTPAAAAAAANVADLLYRSGRARMGSAVPCPWTCRQRRVEGKVSATHASASETYVCSTVCGHVFP